ncbi:hypothetical protein BH11PSE9_BH11PSE9_19080 [soil metagenome]
MPASRASLRLPAHGHTALQLEDILKFHGVGAKFSISAQRIGMTEDDFHSVATEWVATGGGPGFVVVGEPHREAHTPRRRIDRLTIRKGK